MCELPGAPGWDLPGAPWPFLLRRPQHYHAANNGHYLALHASSGLTAHRYTISDLDSCLRDHPRKSVDPADDDFGFLYCHLVSPWPFRAGWTAPVGYIGASGRSLGVESARNEWLREARRTTARCRGDGSGRHAVDTSCRRRLRRLRPGGSRTRPAAVGRRSRFTPAPREPERHARRLVE